PSYYRDLHSFPTRRSSDLVSIALGTSQPLIRVHVFWGNCVDAIEEVVSDGMSPERVDGPHTGWYVGTSKKPLSAGVVETDDHRRDRKSTRLNSSHRTISYA